MGCGWGALGRQWKAGGLAVGCRQGLGGRETQGEGRVPATCLANRAASLDLSPRSGVRYTGGFLPVFPRVLDVPQPPEQPPRP